MLLSTVLYCIKHKLQCAISAISDFATKRRRTHKKITLIRRPFQFGPRSKSHLRSHWILKRFLNEKWTKIVHCLMRSHKYINIRTCLNISMRSNWDYLYKLLRKSWKKWNHWDFSEITMRQWTISVIPHLKISSESNEILTWGACIS